MTENDRRTLSASESSILQRVMEACPVGILVFDEDARLIYLNPMAEKLFGGKSDGAMTMKCGDFFLCANRLIEPKGCGHSPNCPNCPLFRGILLALSMSSPLQDGEAPLAREAGCPPLWIKYKISGVSLNGRGIAVMAVDDITRRKHLEEELRENEGHFRHLYERVPLAYQSLDENGCVLHVNQAWLELLGYGHDEVIARWFGDFLAAEELSAFKERFSSFKEGGDVQVDLQMVRKDGRKILVHVNGKVGLDERGKFKQTHCILYDITERKRSEEKRQALEAQLRQVQKMQAIGTLSGGIAHEFNNILGIILGNAELAVDDIPEWSPVKFHLTEIKTASLRAKEVVRQLLTFSRKTEKQQQPFNPSPAVKETIKFLQSSLPSNIEFRQSISDTCHTIVGNPTQIHQLMLNLSTNAAQAMEEEGGILEFSLENVTLREALEGFGARLPPGEYVTLQVSDTGCGIPADLLERIFDPYFTTKGVGEGTGMGLSVVLGIVTAHGGAIQVQSEVGKGTTFRLFFPAIEKSDESFGDVPGDLPTGSERILFIDDEQSIAAIGKLVLEKLGYLVRMETDPKAALELFAANPARFDLIVTDTTMPGMTGDKLIERVLQIRPDMKIILCTGYSERVDEHRAFKVGAKAYAVKPLDKKQLARIVRRVLDSKI